MKRLAATAHAQTEAMLTLTCSRSSLSRVKERACDALEVDVFETRLWLLEGVVIAARVENLGG